MKVEGVMGINHLLSEEIGIQNLYNSLNINSENIVDIIECNKFIGLSSNNLMTHSEALSYYDLVFKK